MTPEQKQRIDADSLLQRLIETPAGERIRMKCGAADLRSVITDLLSFVKSQEADDDDRQANTLMPSVLWVSTSNDQSGCFEAHKHKHYNDDAKYLLSSQFNSSYEDLLRAASLREQNTETLMRSACVEKVRAMARQWYAEAKKRGAAFSDKGRLAETIATEVESVTLQEREAKQS